MQKIKPDHEYLQYFGRIDWSRKKEPVFVFPCSCFRMRFTGDTLKIKVRNRNAYWDNYLGYFLDGRQGRVLISEEEESSFSISVTSVQTKNHEFLLFKRQDSCHEFTLLEIELSDQGEILPMDPKPNRKIEVYGDSVSAGEVSEAVDCTGKEDPEHNGEYSNSWYSYAWMTARKLNAQIHDIAQGGIALMDRTGWFYEPEAVGMETAWNKIHYNPMFENTMEWDFSRYTPQVVIVAIGQNDSHPEDYMKEDYHGEQAVKWRSHYKEFLRKLRSQYPKASIICCTTLLCHDENWDKSIRQVVGEMQDEKITQYVFQRNGKGTPGHLRISEAEEMAEELAAYIETMEIEGWNEVDE